MGRPRKTLPENGLAIVRTLAANGALETSIAAALGLDAKTWRRIRDEDPDTRAVWEEARTIERDRLVGSLFRQALGAPAEYDGQGNVVRAEQPPVPTAAMFLLKARHGYRDIGPADGSGTGGGPSVVINLPGPLAPEQYAKLITVAPAESARLEAP